MFFQSNELKVHILNFNYMLYIHFHIQGKLWHVYRKFGKNHHLASAETAITDLSTPTRHT